MFNAQSNTPFGSSGGGFGQQQTNTAPAFGSPAPAPPGMFGSPPAAPGGFGAAPATAFGAPAAGGFGAPAPVQGGGLFGAPAPVQGGFGGGGGGFGAPAAGGFGAPAPAPGGMFGAPAPTPGLFGAPAAAPGGFGAPAAGQSPFGGGAPAPAAGFGGGFGAPAPAPGAFGGGGFGAAPAPAPAGFGGFGAAAPAPAPSMFGAPAAAPAAFGGGGFGAPAPSAFGAPAAPATPGLFGAPAAPAQPGLFGAPAAASPGQPGQGGTRMLPYQITPKQDGSSTIQLQAISAMSQYEIKSFEELRFEDYSQGNRGSSTPQASNSPGGFGFASPAPAPAGGGLFGAPAAAPGGFGAPAPGMFGAPAAAPGAFGAPAAPGGFGAPATAPGMFGAPAAAPGGFGAAAPGGFGAPAPAPGMFGAPAAAPGAFGAPPAAPGLFGSPAPAPGAFGAPAPVGGGLFGAPAAAPGAFGAPAAPGGFGAPAPGAFGAPAPVAGGLFGAPAAAPAFGAPAPGAFGAPAAGGLFGAPAAGGFGAPAAPGGFGSPAPAPYGAPAPGGGYGFGAAPAPAYGGYGAPQQVGAPQVMQAGMQPNIAIIPAPTSEILEQGLRALDNQRKQLEKVEAWSGTPQGANTTPTSLSGRESSVLPSRTYTPSMAASPRSAVKIKPRGFPKSETMKSPATTQYATARRDNSGLMSPESHLRSNVMQLRINPNSLKKPNLRLKGFGSPTPERQVAPGPSQPQETITSPPADISSRTPMASTGRGGSRPSPPGDATPSPRTNGASPAYTNAAQTPEYELYQKVIGSGNDSPSLSPAKNTTTITSTVVPKLTKSGYEVSPSIEELSIMSEADLATVPDFCVMRDGYGKVEWEGCVDVRDADLNFIVDIEHKDISVYTHEEKAGKKPPVGSKLNRPAVLTMYNVFCKNGGAAASETDKAKFATKVEKTTKKIGADFISYNRNNGEWKIRVEHFSRYALDDDDTDDENAVPAAQLPVGSPEAFKEQYSSIAKRKATPYKPGRIRFQDLDESDSADMEEDYAVVSDVDMADGNDNDLAYLARVEADKAAAELSAYWNANASDVVESPQKPQDKFVFEDEGEESDDELAIPAEPPAQDDYRRASSLPSISAKLARKAGVRGSTVDYGHRMGRSFRVGWLPDGSFLKLSPKAFGGSPALVQCRPSFVAVEGAADTVPLLLSHLDQSQKVRGVDNECPLFALPRGLERSGTESSHNHLYKTLMTLAESCADYDAKAGFKLLCCLLPTNAAVDPSTYDALVEYGANASMLNARRLAAVSIWLKEFCSASLETDIRKLKEQRDTQAAIFTALSGGAVEMACEIAAEAGEMGLAVALSTDLEGRTNILHQLELLSENGSISKVASATVRFLKDSSGDTRFEDEIFSKGLSGLDWYRRLALRLLQEPESDLAQLMSRYDEDVASGNVPFPCPRYMAGMVSSGNSSLHYRLLNLLADPKGTTLAEVVDPVGFTPSVHDYSHSFHLASAISAVGPVKASDAVVEHILDGYVAQLTSQGLWEWAVFVTLCTMADTSDEAKRSKVERAKKLVLQNFVESDPSAQTRRAFLETRIGVPSKWFEESLAYQAGSRGEVLQFIIHSLEFDSESALEALEDLYLPNIFFMNQDEIDKLLQLIEDVGTVAAHDSLARAAYRFFLLDKRVKSMVGAHPDDVAESLPELFSNFESVQSTLRFIRSKARRSHGKILLVPNTPKSVPLSCMLSEALDYLDFVKLQLKALESSVATNDAMLVSSS